MKHTRNIVLIRHAKTAGNLEKRYIGRTDEPLCEAGLSELSGLHYPSADMVICSPMRRCRQTAKILYPDCEALVYKDLRECDFGDFEGKNYIELSGNPDYAKWIDSGGALPFPNGEAHGDFKARCAAAFAQALSERDFETAAFVVHGGTIMAIMEAYALPKRSFYDYQVKNCHGFLTEFDGNHLTILREI